MNRSGILIFFLAQELKINTLKVLSLIISELSRLKIENLAKEIAAIT